MRSKPTRTERVAATESHIRHVARGLFSRQGFSATGVRDIARRADVDPATVIRYNALASRGQVPFEEITDDDLELVFRTGPMASIYFMRAGSPTSRTATVASSTYDPARR